MANELAISRKLIAAGFEQKSAEALAEVVVAHRAEDVATKADIARLEAQNAKIQNEVEALKKQLKMLTTMMVGLYVALAAFFFSSL